MAIAEQSVSVLTTEEVLYETAWLRFRRGLLRDLATGKEDSETTTSRIAFSALKRDIESDRQARLGHSSGPEPRPRAMRLR